MPPGDADLNESFFALTPERVLHSAEAAGLEPSGHCQALNSLENRVYDLRLESGEHVVAKFYRPGRWSRDQIQEEHDFLFELGNQEIPVCAPLRFPDASSLQEIEGIYFAVWPRTGGRMADEFDDRSLEILGRYLARIHNTGAARTSETRLLLDEATYIRRALAQLEGGDFLPPDLAARYTEAALAAGAAYTELLARLEVPLHRIHGDCHPGNLLHDRGAAGEELWYFLDFDDFLTGPAVQDIWMLFPMQAEDPEARRQRAVLLAGYRQFRELPDAWLQLIEPLRALRYVHYAGWIARRWNDPAFPQAFPHFGAREYWEREYWERETSDLEDQVRRIHAQDPEAAAGGDMGARLAAEADAEGELTNADFFWDWEA